MSLLNSLTQTLFVPLHREGRLFVGLFALTTLALFLLWTPLGWIGIVLTLWCYYFFRNPPRVVPRVSGADTSKDTLIVSPADGMVQSVGITSWPPELNPSHLEAHDGVLPPTAWRISIFMSVFDVHVNRAPFDGIIKDVVYVPGKFFNASLDKASLDNERQIFLMQDIRGQVPIAFTQIAGLIARRITRTTKVGDVFQKGQVFGMIRFGSRVDVFVPPHVRPTVCEGQRVIAGETVIAQVTARDTDSQAAHSSPTMPLYTGHLVP